MIRNNDSSNNTKKTQKYQATQPSNKKERQKKQKGNEYGKEDVSSLGRPTDDDVGKSTLQERTSTRLFLGDEGRKYWSDEYGKRFSPGFTGLRAYIYYWSMRWFSDDGFRILLVSFFVFCVCVCCFVVVWLVVFGYFSDEGIYSV